MSTVTGAVETRDFVESPTYLSDIVGDADSFFVGSWEARPQVFCYPAGTRLLSSADIWEALDCGSLVTPYFCVLSDGGATVNNVTQTRDVLNRPLAGYADAKAIRSRFGSGHTIKLTKPEDWHPDIKKLVAGLRTELRAEVRSFIFFTPQGSSGVPAHADEAHVFVLKSRDGPDWHVGVANGEEIRGEQSAEIGLKSGDALYIPPGRPYPRPQPGRIRPVHRDHCPAANRTRSGRIDAGGIPERPSGDGDCRDPSSDDRRREGLMAT